MRGADVKALTLWRPWTWSIFDLPEGQAKRIENRPWRPPSAIIGAPLAFHAGKHFDLDGFHRIREIAHVCPPSNPDCPEGIVGVVTVVDYLDAGELWSKERLRDLPGQERWFFGPFGWVLSDVVRLPRPVPCKGAQGLWTLPHDVNIEVARQYARVVEARP